MRILSGKNRLKNFLKKSLLYIVICYLLASWGVNGVVNPMHYYRNFTMQEKSIDLLIDNQGIVVEWQENQDKFGYISFEVMDAKNFYNDTLVNVYSGDELLKSEVVELHKGLNSLEIQEKSTYVSISSDVVVKNQLILNDFVLSEYRKIDTWKMVEIFFSMIFLLIIWECIQFVKNRYAK